MNSPISWFEIPVTDLQRATTFYEATLGTTLRVHDDMRVFPYQLGYPSGCLMKSAQCLPSRPGTLVYFDVADKDGVAAALDRALAAGGKTVVPKTDIGEHGFIAIVEDTEGNSIGLHEGPA